MRVTTAEFVRNWGRIADRALVEPVTVTRDGRDRLVMISAEEYARLKRRDRRVVRTEELSEAEVEMIARAGQEEGAKDRSKARSFWRSLLHNLVTFSSQNL